MDVATNGDAADRHDQRLMALLRELVHERGSARTAEALAVDPRTLAASLKRGTPSRLMRAALRSGGREREDWAAGRTDTMPCWSLWEARDPPRSGHR